MDIKMNEQEGGRELDNPEKWGSAIFAINEETFEKKTLI